MSIYIVYHIFSDMQIFADVFAGRRNYGQNRWSDIGKNYFSTQKNTGKVLAGITISGR